MFEQKILLAFLGWEIILNPLNTSTCLLQCVAYCGIVLFKFKEKIYDFFLHRKEQLEKKK